MFACNTRKCHTIVLDHHKGYISYNDKLVHHRYVFLQLYRCRILNLRLVSSYFLSIFHKINTNAVSRTATNINNTHLQNSVAFCVCRK